MSFYTEEKDNKTLTISDDGIDMLIDTFREISKVYKEGTSSKPDLAELEVMLLRALEYNYDEFLDKIGDKEIVECKFKLRKKRNKILYKPGTVFAIKIPKIKKYAYGMLVKGQNITRPYDEETYLEYFSVFTDEKMSISEFKKYYVDKKEVLFTANTTWSGWKNGEWKIIGHIPETLFNSFEYGLPDFISVNNGVYLLSRGKSDIPLIDCEIINEEEGKKIKNPAGIIGHEIIEEWLIQAYYS